MPDQLADECRGSAVEVILCLAGYSSRICAFAYYSESIRLGKNAVRGNILEVEDIARAGKHVSSKINLIKGINSPRQYVNTVKTIGSKFGGHIVSNFKAYVKDPLIIDKIYIETRRIQTRKFIRASSFIVPSVHMNQTYLLNDQVTVVFLDTSSSEPLIGEVIATPSHMKHQFPECRSYSWSNTYTTQKLQTARCTESV